MPKKLLMNNKIDDGSIVLCKNFSPNGQPFVLWEDKKIDWDKYELYINVDITNLTKEWQHILAVSTDNVTSWSGNKLHIYGSPNKIRIQPVVNVNSSEYDSVLSEQDKSKVEIIFNKKGVYLQGVLKVLISERNLSVVFNKLKTLNSRIGSANDIPMATYNLVKLQPYQERG